MAAEPCERLRTGDAVAAGPEMKRALSLSYTPLFQEAQVSEWRLACRNSLGTLGRGL